MLVLVSDWMTTDVITVNPRTSIFTVVKLMKEHNIKHIPVTDGATLKGLISDRLLKEYAPSKATSLDVYELHYLMEEIEARQLMHKKVITTSPDTPIEEAAMVMLDHDIGCLPVIEADKLAGIVSDHDIFRALVDITGIRHGGYRFATCVEDRSGSTQKIVDVVRKYGLTVESVLTSHEGAPQGCRYVVIRATGSDEKLQQLRGELEQTFSSAQK
jgi:acetoin utilization protein AcuB